MNKKNCDLMISLFARKDLTEKQRQEIYKACGVKKDYTPFWIAFMLCASLIAAVALAEFLKWTDDKPDVREQLYLD